MLAAARPTRFSVATLMSLFALLWIAGFVLPASAQTDSGAQDSGDKKTKQKKDSGKADSKDSKSAKKPKGPAVPKKDILVFPADTKGGPSDQLAGIIGDVIKGRLEGSELYQPNAFSLSSPTFRRALAEQTLLPKEVKPPYDTNAKVQKLTQFAGYNYAVTSSVDDYEYDAAKQQVSISITVILIDFSSGKPQPRPYGDSATTAAKAVKDASDTAPVINLARDLTEKIMTEILKPAKPAAK
jgi:hypothetical protein